MRHDRFIPQSAIRIPQWGVTWRVSIARLAVTTSSVLILLTTAVSCTTPSATTTQPVNAYDRQQKALKDPFGYQPGLEKTDISGGKLGTFDKDAFKKDVDRVFNP